MSEEKEIRSVFPSYYGFIMSGLTELREFWAAGDHVKAMNYALELASFLPTKLKNQIREPKEKIQKQIEGAKRIRASNRKNAFRIVELNLEKIALAELEPFVDKMIKLLDSENLLTQQYGVPTRKSSIQNIGEKLN